MSDMSDKNSESAAPAADSPAAAPDASIARIVVLLLGTVFALLAAANSLFHFAPPFVLGIAAGVCFLVGMLLAKRRAPPADGGQGAGGRAA
jgi:hypothetical protein